MTVAPRVAIVGGGLSGMAAAAMLARRLPGVRLSVFERATANRDEGYGLDLNIEGQRTLRATGMFHRYAEVSRPNSNITKMYSAGTEEPLFVSWRPLLLNRLVRDEPESSRAGLRQLFIDAAFEALGPSLQLSYDTPVYAIHPIEEGRAALLLGKDEKPLGSYDLVIDASGVHSNLRHYRVVDPEGRQWRGHMLVHGVVADPEASLSQAMVERIGQGSCFVLAKGYFMALQRFKPHVDDHAAALLFMFHRKPSRGDAWGEKVFDEIGIAQATGRKDGTFHAGTRECRLIQDFMHRQMTPQTLAMLHEAVDSAERLSVRPLFSHGLKTQLRPTTPEDASSQGLLPIVCIGDAILGIGLGGGGNVALQDARELIDVLAEQGVFDPVSGHLTSESRSVSGKLSQVEARILKRHREFLNHRERFYGPDGPLYNSHPNAGIDISFNDFTTNRVFARLMKVAGRLSWAWYRLDCKLLEVARRFANKKRQQ